MRKADLINQIAEKTGIPKVDVLVALETMFKEVKDTLDLFDYRREHWHNVLPPRYGGFGPPQPDIPLLYPAGSEPLPNWENKSWATPSERRD